MADPANTRDRHARVAAAAALLALAACADSGDDRAPPPPSPAASVETAPKPPIARASPPAPAPDPAAPPEISGTVTDEDGSPVAGVAVRLWTTTDLGTAGKAELQALRSANWSQRTKDGRTFLAAAVGATTAADGTFRARMPVGGAADLVIFHPGFAPARLAVGDSGGAARDASVRLRRVPDDARIEVWNGRELLRGGTFGVVDAPEGGPQSNSPRLSIGEDGRVWSGWLTPGHRYLIVVESPSLPRPGSRGFMVWRGEPAVDVAQLAVSSTLDSRPGEPVLR
ncbi:MAG: hypothetical protein HMLKMBBP_03961 [Planctomycetes bacterium]|nr:hypothetical protein [Planctomycetota bacterium]